MIKSRDIPILIQNDPRSKPVLPTPVAKPIGGEQFQTAANESATPPQTRKRPIPDTTRGDNDLFD